MTPNFRFGWYHDIRKGVWFLKNIKKDVLEDFSLPRLNLVLLIVWIVHDRMLMLPWVCTCMRACVPFQLSICPFVFALARVCGYVVPSHLRNFLAVCWSAYVCVCVHSALTPVYSPIFVRESLCVRA